MNSILDKIWYGNICPYTECRESSQERKVLMRYIADHHNHLQTTLTDKQKEMLENSMIAMLSWRISMNVKYSHMRFVSEQKLLLRLCVLELNKQNKNHIPTQLYQNDCPYFGEMKRFVCIFAIGKNYGVAAVETGGKQQSTGLL